MLLFESKADWPVSGRPRDGECGACAASCVAGMPRIETEDGVAAGNGRACPDRTQVSNAEYTSYCVAPRDAFVPLPGLADEAASGDADHVVDDAVAHGEDPVVQVHAAAGVVGDDLQVLPHGGPLVE
jgi:hypothetical protein